MLLLLTACNTNNNKESENTNKVGKANAAGYNGELSVEVQFKDGKIEDVKSEHKETEGLGAKAIDTLTKK